MSENVVSGDVNHLVPVFGSQDDKQTSDRMFSDRVSYEVDNVAGVETRVYDAFSATMDSLVLPRVELALKSVNSSSAITLVMLYSTWARWMSFGIMKTFK